MNRGTLRGARLFRTSAFRLSLLYMLVFSVSVMLLLLFIYSATIVLIDRETNAATEAEIRGLAEQYSSLGLSGLVEVIARRSSNGPEQGVYLFATPAYRPLAGNIDAWPEPSEVADGWSRFTIQQSTPEGQARRAVRARLFDLPGGYHLLVGREIDERLRFRRLMVASFLWALALTVVLGSLGGWLMSRKVLGQVDAFARASRKIADGDLSQRMAVRATGDEFDRLAVSLNDMLEQIDRLTDGMRSVVDSVAHDLRGPLTRLRSRIELSLRAGPDTTRYGEALEAALEESDRILRTLNVLLQIAQAEAGKTLAEMEALDLAVLVRDLAELYQPLAEERAIVLETAATGPAWIAGHGELLTQALVNLLDNALKHTGRGGLVKLSVEMSSRGVEASVADNGPGIAAGERKRALERFVRLDTSAATHGSGLGLSLVAAVAHLHSAVLTLADNEPGLRVTLCFAPA